MRLRSAVTLLLITFIAAPPVAVNGQEDPLPPVVPKAASFAMPAELPTVFLAVEPIRDFRQPTLLEAARANDYVTFDALYRDAKARGESVAAYDTLYELWTYSVTDPIGAFYGRDLYERLARAYPGYARFIDDYRIVDDRGAVFYPTSETRSFLLDRIVEGNTPRVLVAEGTSREAARTITTDTTDTTAASRSTRERRSSGSTAAAGTAARRQNAGGAARRERRGPVTAVGTAARATAAPVTAASSPVTAQPAPVPVATTPVSAPAPVSDVPPAVAETPAVVTTPVQPTAVPPVTAPTPVETAPVQTVPVPTPAPAAQTDSGFATRGILLLVLGIIGIGLLALMLRASDEKPAAATSDAKPVTPFGSAKRPAAPGPQAVPEPPKDEKNRATGSHG